MFDDDEDDDFFAAADQEEAAPDAFEVLGLVVAVPARTPAQNNGHDELRDWELAYRMQKQTYAVIFDEGETQPMAQDQY